MSALRFSEHKCFRQRLVLATLSGKLVKVDKIRSTDNDPGLRDYEVSFLRLLEKVTNGSTIQINETGTKISYKPGVISGGKVSHDCGTQRGIGYFLEAMIALAPFAKQPFFFNFTGITNDNTDTSVDILRTSVLPSLKRFGIDVDHLELKITKRGAPPLGGGEIQLHCPIVRQLRPVQLVDEGRIKRIRGIAYCTRVSPQTANRMVESARGVLNRYIPDVYIYTDVFKGNESGKSPGFGLALVAETTTGVILSAEQAGEAGVTPEDVGEFVGKALLNEVQKGGCVTSSHQWLSLLYMVLGPEDVSKICLGGLTAFSIQFLRDLQDFFGVTMKVAQNSETQTLTLSCIGMGYVNVNKKST